MLQRCLSTWELVVDGCRGGLTLYLSSICKCSIKHSTLADAHMCWWQAQASTVCPATESPVSAHLLLCLQQLS